MIEKFEYRGIWYLPSTPDVEVDGTLYFNPDGRIVLELMGALDGDPFEMKGEEEVILGFTTAGKKITLLNCMPFGKKISFPGIPIVKYSPHLVLEGEHFSNLSDIKFYKLSANMTKLEEWVNIMGVGIDFTPGTGSLTANYVNPDEISFKINDQLQGSFTFSYSAPLFVTPDYTIKQTTSLSLSCNDEISYNQLLKYLWRFRSFITLGIFEDVFMKGIRLYSKNILNKSGKEEAIKLYWPQKNRNTGKGDSVRFLFTYEQIASNFEHIIQTWFQLEEKLSPVISILMDSFSKGRVFNENAFLNIVQALEIYHRRIKENTAELKVKFSEELEPILNLLDSEQRALIKGKLEFGYEPNLRIRLKELFREYKLEPLAKIVRSKGDRNSIINKATISRNYYTHYNSDLKEKACHGMELFKLTEKLRVLLILVVLRETGFSNEEVESLFESKSYMYFNHLYSED